MTIATRRRIALVLALSAVFLSVPLQSAHALPLFGFSPTTLSFPTTVVGDTSAGMDVVVTNLSSSPQFLAIAGGPPADTNFTGVENCNGVTLAAGASCLITYAFAPQTAGAHSTTTSFSINGEDSGTISLSGTATPGFSITPTTLAFPATVVGGTSAGMDVVVTNLASSPQLVTLGGAPPADPNFTAVQHCWGVTLAVGASCVITYQFVPQTVGAHSATNNFSINGQDSGTISLSGTGTTFSITPTTLSFPPTVVGDTSPGMDVVVTNGSASPQVVIMAGGAAGDPNFTGSQNCAGVTLAAGGSCAVTYAFVPQTAGSHSATTSFSINGQDSGTISLSGTATPGFSITPTSLVFPDTAVGDTSAGIAVVVTNLASAPQLVTMAGGASGDANFTGSQNCAGVTVAAGGSCAVTYVFVPQSVGAHSATTSFSINGQDSGTVSLSGTGTATFSITPTTLAFPSTVVGDTSAGMDVVVTNLSSSPQLVAMAGGASGDANFTGSQNCAGVTVAAGGSCAVTYEFVPQTAGAQSATTSFSINGQDSGTISLSGMGTATFSITPTTIAFPATAVGDTSAGIAVVVTNLSASPQLVSMAGGAPGDANFTGSQNCAGVTLAAGGSCAVTYEFVPQTLGAHIATTGFTINGQDSGTISLSGDASAATVTPTPSPSAPASTGGTLADTGSPVGQSAPFGAVLVTLLGVLLLLGGRRFAR